MGVPLWAPLPDDRTAKEEGGAPTDTEGRPYRSSIFAVTEGS